MKFQQGMVVVALAGVVMLGAGCSWVKPKAGAESVALVKASHVSACKLLGNTTSQVKDSVGILKRRDKKVTEELISLAKNAAIGLGGDTIVAKGDSQDGSQQFNIYRCN